MKLCLIVFLTLIGGCSSDPCPQNVTRCLEQVRELCVRIYGSESLVDCIRRNWPSGDPIPEIPGLVPATQPPPPSPSGSSSAGPQPVLQD